MIVRLGMPNHYLSKFNSRSEGQHAPMNISGIACPYLGLRIVDQIRDNDLLAIQIPDSHQTDHAHWDH